ncbi:hypothetical protein JHL18_20105 [Clostridium sp. YIM B02505]|uniref:Uncharacterized protein n=1 Tax=Clostridium yunnanense TaxID=2800325 RepID=A0ABS1EUE6_9CLOT|nr:hypothetical protein [Clostridium yunnanense]MBK1812930.1 hypothetical protein [Clostridium yunnanense]
MYYDEYVILTKEDIESIETKLNIIKLLIVDQYAKGKVDEILNIINKEEVVDKKVSIDEIIYDKMNEAKGIDPELNANLYVLYRKLQDKRIDPLEAMRLYEIYTNE